MSLDDGDSEDEVDHLIQGLVTFPPVPHEKPHLYMAASSPGTLNSPVDHPRPLPPGLQLALPRDVEELLLSAYRDRAQAQYPFFHWPTFLVWASEWKSCSPADLETQSWQGFFVNLVYASAVLLPASPRIDRAEARVFYRSGIALLPHVMRQPDPILHLQAYLLLSFHALHRSSTQRILSLASTTMRHCVQNQLHLADTELVATDPGARLAIQIRRRCFWSAYNLERLVMTSLHVPPSIPDNVITTKLYANIDDDDLSTLVSQVPLDSELPDSPSFTCVSSSLQIAQCRRIQSEIEGYTLRGDYETHYEGSSEWRARVLAELESYKARVQKFSDPQAKGHTSHRWLGMFYHYTLLMLYRPTKQSVLGPAGDWSVQASSQACLIFRKSQMDRQIAQGWLGVGANVSQPPLPSLTG